MIATMDQVLVVGRRSRAKEVLISLQNLGVVQVETLNPDSTQDSIRRLRLEGADLEAKESWDRLVARSAYLIGQLQVDPESQARVEVGSDPAAIERDLSEVAEQVDRLVAERGELSDELELIHSYLPLLRDLAPLLGPLDDARYLAGVGFFIEEGGLETLEPVVTEALGGAVMFASRPYRNGRLVATVTLRRLLADLRSALAKQGVSEIVLPDKYAGLGVAKAAHMMEERARVLPQRLENIGADLRKIGAQHGARLASLDRAARNHQERYARYQDLAEGRYGFALLGWVPSADRPNVVASLSKQFGGDIIVETREADVHHDEKVPVKFENAAWVRPFTGLLALFAPPKYGSFDPSWTLAVFFPLYFGLVVGDMGFAILFAVIAWLLRKRGEAGKKLDMGPLNIVVPAQALKPISTVIFWCAAWAFAWGFVYGEFLGNFLERFPAGRPIFYTTAHHEVGYGLINVPLLRIEVFTPLLLLTIAFGVLQVVGGWLIRIVFGFRHQDMKHVFEGVGMASGLIGIVIFAWAFLNDSVGPLVLGIVGVLLLVFLINAVLAKMPLMLVELISNSGNILSFLRLFAVGLSAALVANLVTDLGFAIGGTLPILGPILGIALGLTIHLLALALTIIGHALQPLRLQYVEFFTKFGYYDESGRPYRPFKLLGGK
ncbi:MAG: hypothetical protein ROY82_04190 [Truepera sp.]|jgi:V/A-type H+-transporting ATPase subunit I|nr:hypothetical protein [Truepera sp.]HRQ10386.1 hypothetical protein [Trueperaceae bacterium]